MTVLDMRLALSLVEFPAYELEVLESMHGFIYLQAFYDEKDTVTGIVERQFTRRWALSPDMSKSEVIATAFKCLLTSMEHRTREWFLYRGRAIYQPHYNVDHLHEISQERETRQLTIASTS